MVCFLDEVDGDSEVVDQPVYVEPEPVQAHALPDVADRNRSTLAPPTPTWREWFWDEDTKLAEERAAWNELYTHLTTGARWSPT